MEVRYPLKLGGNCEAQVMEQEKISNSLQKRQSNRTFIGDVFENENKLNKQIIKDKIKNHSYISVAEVLC